MTRRVWHLPFEDGLHTVELNHGYWTGKQEISVDGELLFKRGANPFRLYSTATVPVGKHTATVVIHPNLQGINYIYDLALDQGPTLGSGEYITPTLSAPLWAWLFLPANASIGIWVALATPELDTLPHAIPHFIAVHGAVRCYWILIDKKVLPEERIRKCALMTLISLGLAILVVLVSYAFFGG